MVKVKVTISLGNFLFLLATVLFLQVAVCRDQDTTKLKLKISEKGTQGDTRPGTRVFKVPAHDGNTRVDVMNDLIRRLTVYRIHDIKTCYVTRLQPDEPSSKTLEESPGKAVSQKQPLPVTRQWVPTERFPTFLLGREALNFCGAYPAYRVVPYSGDSLVNRAQGRERRHSLKEIALDEYQGCSDSNSNCAALIRSFGCQEKATSNTCRRSCGVCVTPCVDSSKLMCPVLVRNFGCTHQYTSINCKKSCNICSTDCNDRERRCPALVRAFGCGDKATLNTCRKTCGSCDYPH